MANVKRNAKARVGPRRDMRPAIRNTRPPTAAANLTTAPARNITARFGQRPPPDIRRSRLGLLPGSLGLHACNARPVRTATAARLAWASAAAHEADNGKRRAPGIRRYRGRSAARPRFRVALDAGHQIIACTAGKMKKNRVKTLAGDRVIIEMSPYNLEKGRRIFRHKDERAGASRPPARRPFVRR